MEVVGNAFALFLFLLLFARYLQEKSRKTKLSLLPQSLSDISFSSDLLLEIGNAL